MWRIEQSHNQFALNCDNTLDTVFMGILGNWPDPGFAEKPDQHSVLA